MSIPYVNGSSVWPLRCSENEPVQIVNGDVREKLSSLPDETVHCCVTSPPYWGMRDYGYGGQIGAEDTVEEYILNLVSCFREVHRVLKADGTFWLNIANTPLVVVAGEIKMSRIKGGRCRTVPTRLMD